MQASALAPFHHAAVKCRDIERSMKFYSLFGLEEACRFRSGAARCAWLTGAAARLELIEVPSYVNATAAPDGLVEEAVGLRREDLIGQFEASQIHPDDFREIRARQAQPIESVGRQPLRYRAKGPGGEWRWIETAGSTRFVGDDGGVYGVSFSRACGGGARRLRSHG